MSAIPADLKLVSPWRLPLAGLAMLLAVIGVLYRDTAVAMVEVWSRSDTFAHAYMVLPISLWLIWRRRGELATLVPRPQPWVLSLMFAAAALWLAADLVVVNSPAQFAFVALLVLAVPAVLGLQVALAMLFPLLFLFFSVPFGEFMLQPMMDWTADFVVAALQLTGIPVHREGLSFIVPNGKWSVVEECSGIRYLIASFMVGSLFAYLNYSSMKRRAIFIGFSLLVPLVANWVRAYLIVMVGYLSDNRIAAGVDHILYGWVFFGVVIFIMFVVGTRWSEPERPIGTGAAARSSGEVSRAMAPDRGAGARVLLSAMVVVLWPHLVLAGMNWRDAGAAAPRIALPMQLSGDWKADNALMSMDWAPAFQQPAATARQVYAGPEGPVGVHVFYYRNQNAQSKLVSSYNRILGFNDRGWRVTSGGVAQWTSPEGPMAWRRTTLEGSEMRSETRGARLSILHAYWIDGRWITGDLQAKVANALARVQGRGDDGAAVVLYSEDTDPARATRALQAFLGANAASLDALLRKVREQR